MFDPAQYRAEPGIRGTPVGCRRCRFREQPQHPARVGDPMRGFAQQVSYPAAMFAPLAALAPEAIVPGASTIPSNTALVLQPDPDLIVAYLVGLNTETSRLLLWRGVPADPTATPFTYFWDQRGQAGGPPDITPIARLRLEDKRHAWQPSRLPGSPAGRRCSSRSAPNCSAATPRPPCTRRPRSQSPGRPGTP